MHDDYPDIPGAHPVPARSLLDYFAANCMSGMLAAQGGDMGSFDHDYQAAAKAAYAFAAAMVAERENYK